MEERFKNSYLAVVTDKIAHEYEDIVYPQGWYELDYKKQEELRPTLKKKKKKQYEYRNRRERIFCTCRNAFDTKVNYKVKKELKKVNEFDLKSTHHTWREVKDENNFEPIICSNCNKEYSNFDEITTLNSKLLDNCISIRYAMFDDDDRIRLVKFMRFAGVNVHSKQMFFVDKNQSITFNKKTKRFYVVYGFRKKKHTESIGIRTASKALDKVIRTNDVHYQAFNPQNKKFMLSDYNRDFAKPLNDFLKKLIDQVDKRDFDRLYEYVESGFLKDKRPDFTISGYPDSFHTNNYLRKLALIISITQFPGLTNILFTKGPDFFLELASKSNFPPPSMLKKNNPTSPRKIIEEIIKEGSHFSYITSAKYYRGNNGSEARERLKNTRDTLRSELKVSDTLYKSITSSRDVKIIEDSISEGIEQSTFNNLCDVHGTRRVFDVLNHLLYDSRNNPFEANEDNFNLDGDIAKHIFKIYPEYQTEEGKTRARSALFGNRENDDRPRFSMTIYRNAMRIAEEIGLEGSEVFKCKDWGEVVDFHDDVVERSKAIKLEQYNEKIKEFILRYKSIEKIELNDIVFKLMSSAAELEKESAELHHCVRTYAKQVSEGRNLIFSIEDKSTKERATLEFRNKGLKWDQSYGDKGTEDIWQFNQLKGKYNHRTSKKMIETCEEFCKKHLEKNEIKYEIPEYAKNGGDLTVSNKKDDDNPFGDLDLLF